MWGIFSATHDTDKCDVTQYSTNVCSKVAMIRHFSTQQNISCRPTYHFLLCSQQNSLRTAVNTQQQGPSNTSHRLHVGTKLQARNSIITAGTAIRTDTDTHRHTHTDTHTDTHTQTHTDTHGHTHTHTQTHTLTHTHTLPVLSLCAMDVTLLLM